jgi:hypothetical protein
MVSKDMNVGPAIDLHTTMQSQSYEACPDDSSEEHEASKVVMKKETKIDSRWKKLTGKKTQSSWLEAHEILKNRQEQPEDVRRKKTLFVSLFSTKTPNTKK